MTFRLGCTRGCRAYGFGFAAIGAGATLDLRSATFRFRRQGTRLVTIRFSGAQERRLRAAVAAHKRITFELFGAAVAANRRLGNVSPARVLVII